MPTQKLSKSSLQELEDCKERGFLIRRGKKNPPFEDHYYDWCRKAGKPFVKLKLRRKFGSIDVDTPSDPGRLDLQGKLEFRAFLDRWGLYPKDDQITSGVADVSLVDIEKMALELVAITQAFLDRHALVKRVEQPVKAVSMGL